MYKLSLLVSHLGLVASKMAKKKKQRTSLITEPPVEEPRPVSGVSEYLNLSWAGIFKVYLTNAYSVVLGFRCEQ